MSCLCGDSECASCGNAQGTRDEPAVYLGDAVYAKINEAGQLELWTSNGIETLDRIYVEPHVYQALLGFVKQHEWPR